MDQGWRRTQFNNIVVIQKWDLRLLNVTFRSLTWLAARWSGIQERQDKHYQYQGRNVHHYRLYSYLKDLKNIRNSFMLGNSIKMKYGLGFMYIIWKHVAIILHKKVGNIYIFLFVAHKAWVGKCSCIFKCAKETEVLCTARNKIFKMQKGEVCQSANLKELLVA